MLYLKNNNSQSFTEDFYQKASYMREGEGGPTWKVDVALSTNPLLAASSLYIIYGPVNMIALCKMGNWWIRAVLGNN